jgi:hypothetical protein
VKQLFRVLRVIFIVTAPAFVCYYHVVAQEPSHNAAALAGVQPFSKKINFISTKGKRQTANPPGWEAYDGSIYTKERGYGWLTDLSDSAWDGGGDREMILPDGARASPKDHGRLELANGHASHSGNDPVVFRVDLPDGWYRVKFASVLPSNGPLPLVDERNVQFRAHDVVFAGSEYGTPLKVKGNRLVEGSGIVEVTDGHLRIVMGDPAYGGWTWSYPGPFWHGWKWWWSHPSVFAKNWYQKITRTVDPGFHGLRINSLEIERVKAPAKTPVLIFKDFFNRDDSSDINSGVVETNQWIKMKLHPSIPDHIEATLYKTSLKLTGPKRGKSVLGVLHKKPSPEKGTIRYSTRVSLFTGEGSKIHSGFQEAGLLILGEPTGPTEFNSTFIGIAFDRSRSETPGWVKYRVGNGADGYGTNLEIPDVALPFRVTEGEYEIVVDHDVKNNVLKQVRINDNDITRLFNPGDRKQRTLRGLFGIRASMDPLGSGVAMQQFYWYYRVEGIPD